MLHGHLRFHAEKEVITGQTEIAVHQGDPALFASENHRQAGGEEGLPRASLAAGDGDAAGFPSALGLLDSFLASTEETLEDPPALGT
jgi:hypothetical protein